MKGIILSAGLGTRLRPITDFIPKPLVPICNIPLLKIIAEHMIACGISDLAFNLHHLPQQIERYVRDNITCRPFFRFERQILGTGGGIAGFKDFLQDQDFFLVCNGDILSNLNLPGLLAAHEKYRPDVTLALVPEGPANVVRMDGSGSITDIRGELGCDIGKLFTFSGIAVYETSVLHMLPQEECYSIIDFLIGKMRENLLNVRGFLGEHPLYWNDVGSGPAYLQLHRHILLENRLADLGVFGPIVLDPCSQVSSGAQLDGFICIGPDCTVSSDSVLRDCILLPGASVSGSFFQNTVIGKDFILEVPVA